MFFLASRLIKIVGYCSGLAELGLISAKAYNYLPLHSTTTTSIGLRSIVERGEQKVRFY